MLFLVEKNTFNDSIELDMIKKYCENKLNSYILTNEFPEDNLNKVIPVGSVDWCERKYGKLFGIKFGKKVNQILPVNYPSLFYEFYKRDIQKKTVSEILTSKNIFIKSAEKYKKWKPFIYNADKTKLLDYNIDFNEKIYCCKAFDKIYNEWRYYIKNGKIVCSAWYDGCESDEFYCNKENIPKSPELPEGLLNIISISNFSGVIDIGDVLMNDNRELVIIETCHPYAIGWYFDDLDTFNDYCELLISFDKFMFKYSNKLTNGSCPVCYDELDVDYLNYKVKLGFNDRSFVCHSKCFNKEVFDKLTPSHYELCTKCSRSIYFYEEKNSNDFEVNKKYCYNCKKIDKVENTKEKFNNKVSNENEIPIDILFKQKLKERCELLDEIDYDEIDEKDEYKENETKNISLQYSSEITDDLKPKENEIEKYYIEFENKEKIEIKLSSILESNPPIFIFNNEYDNTTKPVEWITNNSVKFIAVINKNKFSYDFDNLEFVMSKSKTEDDDRLEELKKYLVHLEDEINIRSETTFIRLLNKDKNKFLSPESRKILFAIHDDKIVFRHLYFKLTFDNFYEELCKKNSANQNNIEGISEDI